jgi:hypothetical protein
LVIISGENNSATYIFEAVFIERTASSFHTAFTTVQSLLTFLRAIAAVPCCIITINS